MIFEDFTTECFNFSLTICNFKDVYKFKSFSSRPQI